MSTRPLPHSFLPILFFTIIERSYDRTAIFLPRQIHMVITTLTKEFLPLSKWRTGHVERRDTTMIRMRYQWVQGQFQVSVPCLLLVDLFSRLWRRRTQEIAVHAMNISGGETTDRDSINDFTSYTGRPLHDSQFPTK